MAKKSTATVKKQSDRSFVNDIVKLWKYHKWHLVIICTVVMILILLILNFSTDFHITKEGQMNSEFLNKFIKQTNNYNALSNNTSNQHPSTTKIYKKYEKRCREILESYFGKPFPSIRPKWLKNPETGFNLELDCYNPDFQLALEYNGANHENFVYHFHKTMDKFEAQQRRDHHKKNKCSELDIYLIIVPHTIPYPDLENHILSEIEKFKTFCATSGRPVMLSDTT